jgi:hypothetical protein
MPSATKGELIQLGHDIRERIRVFCGAHGMQDADGIPILLSACYYLAKHTGVVSDLPALASMALRVWEDLDRAEARAGRPRLIMSSAQPRDVRVIR